MPVQYEFGLKIRELRKRKGLKPEDFANSRFTPDAYQLIESSSYIPVLEEAQYILGVLGVVEKSDEYYSLLRARTRDKKKEETDTDRKGALTVLVSRTTVDSEGHVIVNAAEVPGSSLKKTRSRIPRLKGYRHV